MKKVRLSYEHWQADFEIDIKKAALGCLESLEFFGDPVERTDLSDEATVKAFLQMWGPGFMKASETNAVEDVAIEMRNHEGFMHNLDGSTGIKLLECDTWQLGASDFQVDFD